MSNEEHTLKARMQIEDYYILSVAYVDAIKIIYHAENMKHNREIWLHEYFPKHIAKRHYTDNKHFKVYTHPTQIELFEEGKKRFQNSYDKIKTLNHPSIPNLNRLFESNGTLFAALQYHPNTIPLRHALSNATTVFSEQKIGMIGLSIAKAFVLLEQHHLQISSLNYDTILLDTETQNPLLAYVEYSAFDPDSVQTSIGALGQLFYEIIDKKSFQEDAPLKPLEANKFYSAALCGLVNRMVTHDPSKQIKSFHELQILLQSYESIPITCEQIVCEPTRSKFSSYLSLASLVLIISFAFYVFTQSSPDAKNITWLDSLRYHLAANFGDIKGQQALALMYEKGYYVDTDIQEAIHWYKKAALQGNEEASLSLAHIYKNVISVKDPKMAHAILLKLAMKGNKYAQQSVGYNYMQAEGVTQDYERSKYWFQKAYEQGDAYSCGAIGLMYATGKGVTKDLHKALEWFQKGIDRNDTYSKKTYPIVEEELDRSTRHALYEQSRREYKLGYEYERGVLRNKDHTQALKHYTISAKLGNNDAEFRLAQLYERSEQIPKDYTLALYWYKQAAEHGNKLAYYRISQLYRAGKGVKKDDTLALQWCKEAADRGLGVAQSMMGTSYEFGWGTNINYATARYWYQLAIESGYENASKRLDKLNQKIQKKVAVPTKKQSKSNISNVKSSNISIVNTKACISCHGQYFEKSALGKSAIVANMDSVKIAIALIGYKYGTYGGDMKVLMRRQVVQYSDAALEKVAKTIGRKK